MSPATNRPYPLTMVCEAWRVARSSVYALRAQQGGPPTSDRQQSGKRGPKTALSDEELVGEIRTVLKASPFLGEGHRKVKARLAAKGIRVGKNRVLRLMREHGLLAPVRRGHPRGDRSHSGRIRTERPDELWGTDASRFWTKAEGWCWFFAAVDHCASDVVGWHVAKKGDRWAALEPIRQGVRAHMGGFDKAIALGLGLRHDWGSQYRAKQFQAEIKWLGIRSTPAYVGEPECNGVAERFIRTLKEECIYRGGVGSPRPLTLTLGTDDEGGQTIPCSCPRCNLQMPRSDPRDAPPRRRWRVTETRGNTPGAKPLSSPQTRT